MTEKRIHELNLVGDKTDLYLALDDVSLPEAVKFPANDLITKAYTDTLYVKLSGNETVNGVKTWVNQQVLQNGADVTGGNISIQSGGKLSVNKAIGTNIVEIGAAKGALKMILADTTDGYTEILYGEDAQNKWGTGIWADTFATGTQQNAFYIYQYYNKAGAVINQTRFMIDNSGNVGIGTIAPALKFNVIGQSYFSTNLGIGIDAPTNILHVVGNPYINGNLGIGTDSPAKKLHIYDGSSGATPFTNAKIVIESNSDCYLNMISPNTSVQGIMFGDPESAFSGYIRYNHSTNDMQFYTNALSKLTIDANGYIGIGITSPSTPLEIYNTGDLLRLTDSSATGNPSIQFYQTTTYRALIQYLDSGANLKLASKYGIITFWTGTSGTETEFLRIDSAGKVGIKTTSPSRDFEVNGIIGAGNNTDGILIYLSGTVGTILGRDMANTAYNDIEIRTGASPNGIYINTSGNIGIGINSPGNRLHIYENTTNTGANSGLRLQQANASGDIAISFLTLSSTFCMGIDNSVTGDPFRIVYGTDLNANIFFEFNQTYQVISPRIRDNTTASSANVYIDSSSGILQRSTSSSKVKDNITYEIDPKLVFKLKPCSFDSKVNDNKSMLGFIAEQVNEIDERFASGQDNKDGLLGLEINAILAAAVAGLQDVNKRLTKLEKSKTK